LDFAQAFEKFSWNFLFLTMKKLEVANEAIDMVSLLLKEGAFVIYFNEKITPSFHIKRGVRQG